MPNRQKPPAVLLYASTDKSADQLYFGGFHAPDPFIAIGVKRKKIAVLNSLEFARGLKESSFDEILPLEVWQGRATKNGRPDPAGIIATLARHLQIRSFLVPADFPVRTGLRLLELGLALEIAEGSLFPGREIKNDKEVRAIREGNRCSAAGIAVAESLLRASKIKRGRLYHQDRPLTSERVREAVDIACLKAGGRSDGTIVAGGDQACDPHCRGSGPLRAGELIIVDVFPRISRTGYHGDMTRTFLKGQASDAQRALVATVCTAQKEAINAIKARVSGAAVHRLVESFFHDAGYETVVDGKNTRGFFHGTGHGLGLDVHESPRVSKAGSRLKKGAVVTVEPGLYYPGLGGCRIEDVVQITATGTRKLSRYHYDWHIP